MDPYLEEIRTKAKPEEHPILKLDGIKKRFPGVQALDNVSLTLFPGEVHAVVGENGAGKSTLMKILSGIYLADQGEVIINSQPVNISNPREAMDLGITTIYQDFNLVPVLSIAENIFLGNEKNGRLPGLINRNVLYKRAEEILSRLKVDLNARTLVYKLSVAKQQIVEIAKALVYDSKVLIMDEPTASLSKREVESLFDIIRSLKEHGTGILYVSHRLEEVSQIADRVTVLRDGVLVGTRPVSNIDTTEIVQMMIGRSIDQQYPYERHKPGEPILELKDLTKKDVFYDINLTLHRGEIVGLAGLVGAGRTNLVRAIFGAENPTSGEMLVGGRVVEVRSPKDAIDQGIALVPEDRKQHGLVLSRSVRDNVTLASLNRIFKSQFVSNTSLDRMTDHYVKQLDITTPSLEQEVMYLSGGNQQKVVLAKWLLSESEIVIFDEPTRGIDVGAKVEIYNIMNQLAQGNKAVLMISSELPEILGMSDRVLVMRDGRIVAEYQHEEATEDKIIAVGTGIVR